MLRDVIEQAGVFRVRFGRLTKRCQRDRQVVAGVDMRRLNSEDLAVGGERFGFAAAPRLINGQV